MSGLLATGVAATGLARRDLPGGGCRAAHSVPICLPGSGGAKTLAEHDEAAVLSHGKALAAQDGFTWELDHTEHFAGRGSHRGKHFLSEDRRQEYLELARAELFKETGDA